MPALPRPASSSMITSFATRKRALFLLSGAALAGCVGAASTLWSNVLAESSTTTHFAAIDAADAIYQGFTLNGASIVRKIASDGTEAWRQVINENDSSPYETGIAVDSGGIIATNEHTQLVRLNADGTVLWQRQVAPADGNISSLSRFHEGRFYLSYRTPTARSILALDEQGSELWAYTLDEDSATDNFYAPKLTALDSGNLAITLSGRTQSRIYLFDAQGALLREMTLENEPWQIAVASNHHAAFIINDTTLTKLAPDGAEEWNQQFPGTLHCDDGGNEELVCTYDISTPLLDAFTRTMVIWISSDGQVRQSKTLLDTRIAGGSMSVTGLRYNGGDKWILQEYIENELINPLPETYKSYTRYKILTDQGAVLRTINLKPTKFQYDLCLFECPGRTGVYLSYRDSIQSVMPTHNRLYTAGTTSENSRGFVSAYALDPNVR